MSQDRESRDTERKPIDLGVEPHPTPESTDMGDGDPVPACAKTCGGKTQGCDRNTRPGGTVPPAPRDEHGRP